MDETYDQLKKCVVRIVVDHPLDSGYSLGTGFIVSRDCQILTCDHLLPKKVTAGTRVFCGLNQCDKFLECEIIRRASELDTALLKIKDKVDRDDWDVVEFSKDKIAVGMNVFAIGHPRSLCYSSVMGHVSYACRVLRDIEDDSVDHLDPLLPLIQISNVHGGHGISGSPAFNSSGKVIGMFALGIGNISLDFAIDRTVLQGFIERGQKRKTPEGRTESTNKKQKTVISRNKGRFTVF